MTIIINIKTNKNKKGFAILNAMIVFVFIVTIAFIITAYVSTNAQQIYMQDINIQSRFLAMSGVELAVDGLLREQPVIAPNTPWKLIDSFNNGQRNDDRGLSKPLEDTKAISGMGEVKISVYRGVADHKVDDPTGEFVWVKSVGMCKKGDKVVAKTTALVQINLEYPSKASMNISFGE